MRRHALRTLARATSRQSGGNTWRSLAQELCHRPQTQTQSSCRPLRRGFAAGSDGAPTRGDDSSRPQAPPPPQARHLPRCCTACLVLKAPLVTAQANVVRLDPPFGALSTLWWHLRGSALFADALAWTVRNAFDHSFDLETLVDGASDAFAFVHELLAAGDVTPLADLASPPVYDAFRGTLSSYADVGQRLVSIKITELRSVALLSVAFRRGSDLGIDDEAENVWAGLPEQPHTSHGRTVLSAAEGTLYLTVRVRFDSTELVELATKGGGDDGGGEAMHVIENRRGHIWKFARCLPRALPAEELTSKWRLVGLE